MSYFEKAAKIYPRRVRGTFRTVKWIVMIALLGLYYAAPWLRWDRGPHVPDQAIFIDLTGQRGYFFGIEIWPQEVYLLVGILILAAIGLFFATALLGRVWCGYACPQTVWTDLFVWVERFVQGDRNARKKLDDSRWTVEKLWKKGLTHLIWLVIGALTGGAWVFYFNDAPTLLSDMWHGDASWSVIGWIVALTLSTYFMAGFARENVCTYMCPYARFQSAMFDKDTLIISYQPERGEPRGKHKKGDNWDNRGHCIDCTACVVVCPMGIDIRDGLQMECISCGLCIDACNDVMKKLDLPGDLIRYDTENNQTHRLDISFRRRADRAATVVADPTAPSVRAKPRVRWVRPRTISYALILTVVGSVMLGAILTRQTTELNIIHNRAPQFVRLSDGDVRNAYSLKILNKSHEDRRYTLLVEGVVARDLSVLAAGDVPVTHLSVPANSVGEFRVRLTTSNGAPGRTDIRFVLTDPVTRRSARHDSYFVR
ncbi:cytochrome c oxidase accessory protein CcoG [Asticcacaulis sp. BYS171W]|uniref:Cytochrome c oxidase accessory protein CcoG n=1 Tax=Asticcacaulis aquaticus TaxID=2984212 RepID=A0ABT5HZ50_9CAUL|nr:cytochrome c oxidase accessory protein CcoG [Asticcacaulis aquaticus]MDC7685269.1 cytochrome c oxidase accessory protein CcoG [Asticcacaulis aquaticus]